MNESLYDWYCDYILPKGPHGKTVEDVQSIADKYMDLPGRDRLYAAMKELLGFKRDTPHA